MEAAQNDSQPSQQLLDSLVDQIVSSLSEAIKKELTESSQIKNLIEQIENLHRRIEKIETQMKVHKPSSVNEPIKPSSFVLPSFLGNTNGRPMPITRSKARTPVRPTVIYRESTKKPTDSLDSIFADASACAEQGCKRKVHCRGLCSLHYQRLRQKERKIEHKHSVLGPILPPPAPIARTTTSGVKKEKSSRGIFALLYEEKGKKLLAGLINQIKFNRTDLVKRLNETHDGLPGIPLSEEDVMRAVHYHKLTEFLAHREADIICRHLQKQKGSLVKTAQKIKIDLEQLKVKIEELNLGSTTSKIRNGFIEEILDKSDFQFRLDLALTKEKYLVDLGIDKQVDASLKNELAKHLKQDTSDSAIQKALCLDEERYQRLIRRFDLEGSRN